ncbi:Zn2/Cys6 DNA-binding protein [Glarea lozoyensis ATCC 20868]|uniref:Zn2/Cys6 DNA-binding protein n=1 Tax=Glarea lozoyensis (strain ATCC 20868 / MF5171) TaxID=1116229 RepID=S3CY92_GLAL2|nr:Zn2/Cys6 DNA-binding protein [Glarea lozoyensis ATCC 20868]EPE30580.1 Zn2/Cys6 DNA-binding protein [Glarea lozoyensis ATCC 20868]
MASGSQDEIMFDDEMEDSEDETLSDSEPELNFDVAVPEEDVDDYERLMAERRAIGHGATLNPEYRNLAILMNSKRNVQTGMVGLSSSYIDNDNTGDYDPDSEPSKARKKKKKPKAGIRKKNAKGSAVKLAVERELIVKLSFKQDASLTYLRSISKSLSPGDSEIDSSISSTSSPSLSNKNNDSFAVLEPRRKYRTRIRLDSPQERADGLTLSDLTDGHPQRRGCKSCFLSGDDECSLLQFRYDYPCAACEDGGHDCELIVPPTLKLSCLGCKTRKSNCSYKFNGGKGISKCEECDELDEPCCAPPLDENSSYAKRFEIISISPPQPLFERTSKSCQQCRIESRSCSLKSKTDIGPCGSCKKGGQECRFLIPGPQQIKILEEDAAREKVARKDARLKILAERNKMTVRDINGGGRRKSTNFPSPTSPDRTTTSPSTTFSTPTPTIKPKRLKHKPSSPSPKLKTITIETSLAHPLTFMHNPTPSQPCSWCTTPFFGIYGHGPVNVTVFPFTSSQGNIEISETGHHKFGRAEPSRMCVACTFERVRVVKCSGHVLRAINEGVEKDVLEELNQSLKRGEGWELARSVKWCSICASIANFSCCTSQPYSASGTRNPTPFSASNPEFIGCGLHLCKICEWTFRRLERSKREEWGLDVLGQLVETRRAELWRWRGDELRADCELLGREGEMMRRLGGMGV